MSDDNQNRKSRLKYSGSKVDVSLDAQGDLAELHEEEVKAEETEEVHVGSSRGQSAKGKRNAKPRQEVVEEDADGDLEEDEEDEEERPVVAKSTQAKKSKSKKQKAEKSSGSSLASMIRFYSVTEMGFVRKTNEDGLDIIDRGDFKLFTVIDGMGGPDKGEVASRMVIEGIHEALEDKSYISAADVTLGIKQANEKILELVAQEPNLAGMGGTVTCALFDGDKLYICHIGNCRLYRYDLDKNLTRLTIDHTLEEEMGEIDEHGFNLNRNGTHMLTRSFGGSADIDVEWWQVDQSPERGETYLLSSDGLFDCMTSGEIVKVLEARTSERVMEDFAEIFIKRGGKDNMTAILIRVGEEAEVQEDADIDVVGEIFAERPNPGAIVPVGNGSKEKDRFSFDLSGFGNLDDQSDEDFLNDLVKTIDIKKKPKRDGAKKGASKLSPEERRQRRKARMAKKANETNDDDAVVDELVEEVEDDVNALVALQEITKPKSTLKSKEEIRASLMANLDKTESKGGSKSRFSGGRFTKRDTERYGANNIKFNLPASPRMSIGTGLVLLLIGGLIGSIITRHYDNTYYPREIVRTVPSGDSDKVLGAFKTTQNGKVKYVVVATRDVLSELQDDDDGILARQAMQRYFQSGEFVQNEEDLLHKVALLKSPSSRETLVEIISTLAKVYHNGDERLAELAKQHATTNRILEKLVKQLDYLAVVKVRE